MTALLAAGLLAAVVGCGRAVDPWDGATGSPRVVVTIAPLAAFVRAVGGDRVAVRSLCTTTGPHHYQLDTKDARLLTRADLLLAIGLRLDDSFADPLRPMASRPDLPYVKLGQRLAEKKLLQELKHTHEHGGDDDHHHHHGKYDPHVWLGIPQVVEMIAGIRDELSRIDSDHADEYRANAAAYVEKLKALQADGLKQLKDARTRRLISFHEALGYLASSFELEIADVIEQGPGDEPTSAHLAKLVRRCQDPKAPIAAITVEPQYPKSSSATIVQRELRAKGLDVPLVEIDPLETADAEALHDEGGDWYEKRMRQNLQALAKALK
ncbi:MAG: metal ABC transporter substrate-binding protein [Gemmataceae bacterium]